MQTLAVSECTHSMLTINARFLTQPLTGVQRYALGMSSTLVGALADTQLLRPPGRLAVSASAVVAAQATEVGHLRGHMWEQFTLPRCLPEGALLWSPGNVGPVHARNHVVTIHDLFAVTNPEWVSRRFHYVYTWLVPQLAQRARHLLTVSAYSKSKIVDLLNVDPEKISVIPPGFDPEIFNPLAQPPSKAMRKRLGLPSDYILTLSSLEPRKNLGAVIKAWRRIPGHCRLPLVVAGAFGRSAVFGSSSRIDDAANGPQPHLVGRVSDSDLPSLYAGATAFVYVSLEEGFGIPPLEALACGVPLVTSNTSALSENYANFALLVDPKRDDDISQSIEAIIDGSWAPRAAPSVHRELASRFSWHVVGRQIARLFEQLGAVP